MMYLCPKCREQHIAIITTTKKTVIISNGNTLTPNEKIIDKDVHCRKCGYNGFEEEFQIQDTCGTCGFRFPCECEVKE